MKKRVLAGMVIALAVCSITACGKNKSEDSSAASASVVASETESQTSQTQDALTAEGVDEDATQNTTQDTAQTAAQETVSASISLDEDMASVSYTLLARMISDYQGNAAYDVTEGTNENSFWTELQYLVSAYGTNNTKISYDETSGEYTLKKAQLRYYAASLYSDLGKAKKLPDIGVDSVTKKGSKWKVAATDTSAYDIALQSCSKQDSGSYRITAYLVDTSNQTALGEYAAVIKKSPYKGKKSPFHYTIVSLSKMTKMSLETVLVGDVEEETTQTTQAGLTATDQTGSDSTTQSTGDSSTSYGTVLSMPGTTASTTQTTTETTQTTTETTQSTAATTGTDDSANTTAASMDGASITSDEAMAIAKKYYGEKANDGTDYQYIYAGTTTYQNVPYYNFTVSDGTTTVINVLVSGDGARIYKGTNTNDSWTMQ